VGQRGVGTASRRDVVVVGTSVVVVRGVFGKLVLVVCLSFVREESWFTSRPEPVGRGVRR
jgi:hypothetical protein